MEGGNTEQVRKSLMWSMLSISHLI